MGLDRLNREERTLLGQRLRTARELARFTMRGVAESMGVNVNSVVQWERGSVPTSDRRAALAVLYGIPEDQLFAEVLAHETEARALLRLA
jgi:transcriptional regulator with XRE-family HTH domain